MSQSDEEKESLNLHQYMLPETDPVDLDKVDYVIAYTEYAKTDLIKENRENYLANLEKNGLKLRSIVSVNF